VEEAFHEHAEFGGPSGEIGRNECGLVFVSGESGKSLNMENDEIERDPDHSGNKRWTRSGNSADPALRVLSGVLRVVE
jgi:hypothetical protein